MIRLVTDEFTLEKLQSKVAIYNARCAEWQRLTIRQASGARDGVYIIDTMVVPPERVLGFVSGGEAWYFLAGLMSEHAVPP